jgi:hypothetical protein
MPIAPPRSATARPRSTSRCLDASEKDADQISATETRMKNHARMSVRVEQAERGRRIAVYVRLIDGRPTTRQRHCALITDLVAWSALTMSA